MRKEPPLSASKSVEAKPETTPIQYLKGDVFAVRDDQKAKTIGKEPTEIEAAASLTIPKSPMSRMSRIQIEVLIEKGDLEAVLPKGFDAIVKAELPSLVAAQKEKNAVEKSNELQTGIAALMAAVGLGWLGYSLSEGHLGIMIGLTILGFFGGSMVVTQFLKDRVPVDDFEDRFPHAVTEQRILKALDNLNAENKILQRALDDGFIKQRWLDNMNARRRIENDIAKARQQLEYYSASEARERREGKGVSAATAILLADAQAQISVSTAELTGSQMWTYPNIAKCRERYSIDRFGPLKKNRD